MALSQNILFFDINYGEFASVTGTNLYTETALFGYDNRSVPLVSFSTCTGEFIYDYGAGVTFNLDTFILCNHNFSDFSFAVFTGTAWDTQVSYANHTLTTTYYNTSTLLLGVEDAKVTFTGTIGSEPGYFGEFITTKKKFQLACNPSSYRPQIEAVGPQKIFWTGLRTFNPRSDNFTAQLDWNFLMGNRNSVDNTDLQYMTELSRKKTSFLFWPNANNEFPNMFTWRKQDIFKCKIMNDTEYEFSRPSIDYALKASFILWEVK